jgi:hypothetical protein
MEILNAPCKIITVYTDFACARSSLRTASFKFKIDSWCLTPLSAIIQLYHGDQFVVEEARVPGDNHRPNLVEIRIPKKFSVCSSFGIPISTRLPPIMEKQLVSFTCGCESSALFCNLQSRAVLAIGSWITQQLIQA